ncbi:MAG: GNAT family protein [Bdellovibrionales bacterium]
MLYLRPLFSPLTRYPHLPFDTSLKGRRVFLRMGAAEDWKAWHTLRDMSREFLTPWEPLWNSHALEYGYYCGLLKRHTREWERGEGYAFHIFLKGEGVSRGALLGEIALTGVERGISQRGTLGYWVGMPYAGRGYMREAAELVCAFAFERLRLHRLDASCLPDNEPSARLLHGLGFEREGYARAYLRINGQWRDHLLWGLINPNEMIGNL